MAEGVTVEAALQPAAAPGDVRLAESLVANLVDNALRHKVPGGRVTVSTAVTAGGSVLSVSNTGPVIPAAEVDRLFQPFQRLGGERLSGRQLRHEGGYGLGLAIVRAIAEAHRASLTARARPGGGLDVEVTFPRG